MKVAILQTPVSPDKGENLRVAALAVRRAAEAGAVLAVLPEMFCCPYDTALFQAYAEDRGGEAYAALSLMARKNRLTLVGGSLPERDGERLYNTAFVFAPDGTEIARHRKAHLFDIAVTGGQQFQESAVFSPGAEATVFDCQGRRFGLGVCFDIRFPELSRRMVHLGAEALVFPAAFNMTTGPLHWKLAFRSRAVDNQVYTLGAAPARDGTASYVSYGNSLVCDPWGRVITQAAEGPAVVFAELDFGEVARVRRELPLLSSLRPELY